MDNLQYPIGKFDGVNAVSPEQRAEWIKQIAEMPSTLRAAIQGLSPEQLDTPYRPGGWTVRQVVHHLPDSHMNGYIFFKLAMTEDKPIIKPYLPNCWAELNDYRDTPVGVSLLLLEALHQRWVTLLSSLRESQYRLTFTNPESGDSASLETALGVFAWHGRHHVAHITTLRTRMGW